ncbi:WXG100 family type VII secretion target [Streptomyces sp. NPDC002994]|uniref:WXG100 family type VII secretion target n=1 Tax=Streptomyces sp. NPDC002994 TaxID=3154441 RepID=UPI0033A84D05
MSGHESVGEELVELGIELVNPGGRPEELRQAAKAWRRLQAEVAGAEGLLKALDRKVEDVVGDTWRGPAAEAFEQHWHEVSAAIAKSTAQYDEVARQLDEAADTIEQVNSEIHDIYIEIGVSIGVGVALSFVTLGLGSAAAATNVARLAAQAIGHAERLGRLLTRIAAAMRAYQRSTKLTKLLVDLGINWAGNTSTTLASAAATGEGVDGAGLREATWQGVVASLVGTPLGMAGAAGATALLRNRGVGQVGMRVSENVVGGAVGNVGGGVAVDGVTKATGREKPEWLKNAVVNAAGGGVGGAGGVGIGAAAHHRFQAAGSPPVPRANPDAAAARPPGGGRQEGGPRSAADARSGGAGEPPTRGASPRQRDIRDDFG